MKKSIVFLALISVLATSFLLFTQTTTVRATGAVTRWVGDVEGVGLTVINGPPNSTGYYNITESNPGLIVYSLTQDGTYSNSLILPFTLDANGNSSTLHYYDKAVAPGQTTQTNCSPQVGCAFNSARLCCLYSCDWGGYNTIPERRSLR